MTDPARLSMLLAGARIQAERAQAEVEAMTSRLPRAVFLGEALQSLVRQLHRLRANPCPTMRHGFTVKGLRDQIREELDECAPETEGSERAQAEAMDLLGAALHHAIAQGVDPLVGLDALARKLEGRNDARDRGLTWAQAKAEERR